MNLIDVEVSEDNKVINCPDSYIVALESRLMLKHKSLDSNCFYENSKDKRFFELTYERYWINHIYHKDYSNSSYLDYFKESFRDEVDYIENCKSILEEIEKYKRDFIEFFKDYQELDVSLSYLLGDSIDEQRLLKYQSKYGVAIKIPKYKYLDRLDFFSTILKDAVETFNFNSLSDTQKACVLLRRNEEKINQIFKRHNIDLVSYKFKRQKCPLRLFYNFYMRYNLFDMELFELKMYSMILRTRDMGIISPEDAIYFAENAIIMGGHNYLKHSFVKKYAATSFEGADYERRTK